MTGERSDAEYRVRLRAGGVEFPVRASEPVLDAARRAGLDLPHACRGGRCGLCAARLLSGVVDYPAGTPAAVDLRAVPADFVLLCRAHPQSDLELDIRPIRTGDVMRPRRLPARVASVEMLAPDLKRVRLKLPRAEPLNFRAGQYVDIVCVDGSRRSYSIASAPSAPADIELHIRRGSNAGVGARLYDDLNVDAVFEVEGPYGEFVFDSSDGSRPLVLVAGGTGYAPMKSILDTALALPGSRPIALYRGARNAEELYDHDRLVAAAAGDPRLVYVAVLSDAPDAAPPLRRGLVHEALIEDFAAYAAADVYAAGPPPMLQALRSALFERGLAAERFHSDLPAQ